METILNRPVAVNKTLSRVLAVSCFILLTGLGAFVRIPLPFTPVPLTLQTFFVLLSGALLGRKLGFISQAGYLLLGLLGVPLFTGYTAGALYFYGVTAGYIVGFLPAALISASLKKEDHWGVVFAKLSLADAVILAAGTLWLKLSLGISLGAAALLGFVPFIVGDLLKIFVGAALYKKLYLRIRRSI